jgi:hypothetical protein
MSFAISDVTSNLTTGVAKKTHHWPYNFTGTSCFIGVSTPPSGGTLTIDINGNNGNTIFSTRPGILSGHYTSLTNGTQPVLSATTFTKGHKISCDIDSVGLTTPGKEATVYIIGKKSFY